MAGTFRENEGAQETAGTELGDHGSAHSPPLVARVVVQAATLAAAVECLAALVAASIIGWALTMNPTAGPVPLHALKASSEVVDLVGLAVLVSAYASLLLAATLVLGGAAVIRWRSTAPAQAYGHPGFVACWVAWIAVILLRGGIALGAVEAGTEAGLSTLLVQQLATVVVDVGLLVGTILLARLMARTPPVQPSGQTSGTRRVGASR